jgi:hypothetical protein
VPIVADTNSTSGEVSQTFLGRADQQRFPNAAQRIENFLLTLTGMKSKRPGFELMGTNKFNDRPVRLRRFQFSDQSGNILELGDLYVRIWATNGQVISGGVPVEIVTTFPAAELGLLGFSQSADFLFVVHENRGIFTIKKFDAVTWQFASFGLIDGPYGPTNSDVNASIQFDNVAGPSTSTVVTFTGVAPLAAGDEFRLIRVRDGNDGGGNPAYRWLIITTLINTFQANADWQQFPSTIVVNTPQLEYRLGLYSDRLGWPKTAQIHESRLVLGGAKSAPDRLDGSAIADFQTFAPTDPLVDNGAWGYTLGQENVNRIVAMGASNDLIVLSTGAEHHVAGDSTGTAITPSSIWQKPISPDGARPIEPIESGVSRAFVDKYGMNIRAITFDIRFQNYAPDNLTKLADHMYWQDPSSTGFSQLAFQGNPIPTLWTVRGNGELAGAIYEPQENVLGWHRHPMGMPLELQPDGSLAAAGEPPVVESLDIMKGPAYDELWASVVRVLPSGTLRTIERMRRPAMWDFPYQRQCLLDCSQQVINTPTADLLPAAVSGQGVAFSVQNVTGGFAFAAGDVGRFIKQRYRKAMPGDAVPGYTITGRPRFRMAVAEIKTFVSATQVLCDIRQPFPKAAVVVSGNWGLTVSILSGLDMWEGLYVQAQSDGNVCRPARVVAGQITLDVPGFEVNVGLNYTALWVSLPLDPGPQAVIGQGRQVRIDSTIIRTLNSVGGEFASIPETDEERVRWEKIPGYEQGEAASSAPPVAWSTDKKINLAGEFTRRAIIAIRQADPLPLNVLLEVNHVYAPFVQP